MTLIRKVCELVRNGRIGQLKTVEVSLPEIPVAEAKQQMTVPSALDAIALLRQLEIYYTEDRVHTV